MRATTDYNLGKLYPDLAKEWHPTKNGTLTPYKITAGSGRKVWWLCEKAHEWEAPPLRRKNGSGCPKCYKMQRKKGKKGTFRLHESH